MRLNELCHYRFPFLLLLYHKQVVLLELVVSTGKKKLDNTRGGDADNQNSANTRW